MVLVLPHLVILLVILLDLLLDLLLNLDLYHQEEEGRVKLERGGLLEQEILLVLVLYTCTIYTILIQIHPSPTAVVATVTVLRQVREFVNM